MVRETSFAVRIDAELLSRVRGKAATRDETVSQVVRRLLREYAGEAPAQLDLEVAIAETGFARKGNRKGSSTGG